MGHQPKREKNTEVEDLKRGEESFKRQVGPMLDDRQKSKRRKETYPSKEIYTSYYKPPFDIMKYMDAGKSGRPNKFIRLIDNFTTKINPTTGEEDGNWRYKITSSEEVWSIFPIHCKIKSIEDCFEKYHFLSHPKVKIPIEEGNDEIYYLPFPGGHRPIRGWIDHTTRRAKRATQYLTMDHLHLFLAMMTRNYKSNNWKRCAYVDWKLSDLCKEAAPLQKKMDTKGFLDGNERNAIERAVQSCIKWVNQIHDVKDLKFIFYYYNIVDYHYTAYVIVNPWCVLEKHKGGQEEDLPLHGFFHLDSMGGQEANGNNTPSNDTGMYWFLNMIFSYVEYLANFRRYNYETIEYQQIFGDKMKKKVDKNIIS